MNKKMIALLGVIVAASAAGAAPGYHMATTKEIEPLAKDSLVETNPDMKDGDKVATRATASGIAFYEANKDKVTATKPREVPTVAAASGFVLPADYVAPTAKKKGAADVYGFDTMKIGDATFVPNTEAVLDRASALVSTVAAAERRFAVEIPGETRIGRGGKVMPATRETRKFTVIAVKSGVAYGSFTAPADGAVILRMPDAEAPAPTATA